MIFQWSNSRAEPKRSNPRSPATPCLGYLRHLAKKYTAIVLTLLCTESMTRGARPGAPDHRRFNLKSGGSQTAGAAGWPSEERQEQVGQLSEKKLNGSDTITSHAN